MRMLVLLRRKMKVILLLLSVLVLSAARTYVDEERTWEQFKTDFEKVYSTPGEELFRRSVWENTKAFIRKHNIEADMGKHSSYVGMNHFGDWTHDEFYHSALRKKRNTLTLSSVNVARGKQVWEISHYKEENRAAVAVDGSRSNNGSAGQCSQTKQEDNPWWVVDLGTSYIINQVKISARRDCCVGQISNIVVGVSDTNPVDSSPKPGEYKICYTKVGYIWNTYSSNCYSIVQGRYIILQMPGRNRILSLCEVEVYVYQ